MEIYPGWASGFTFFHFRYIIAFFLTSQYLSDEYCFLLHELWFIAK